MEKSLRQFLELFKDVIQDRIVHDEGRTRTDKALLLLIEDLLATEDAITEAVVGPDVVEPAPEPTPEPKVSYLNKKYSPSLDTRKVYVSSSGSDDNSGLAEDTPVKTIKKGLSLIRDGHPDWLLFRRGDTWHGETFGNLNHVSGRSEQEPIVIGSYGDLDLERPVIDTLDKPAVNVFYHDGHVDMSHIVFCSLHLLPSRRRPSDPAFSSETSPAGIRWLIGTRDLRIDDCRFEYFHTNLVIHSWSDTSLNNVKITNCCIFNAYSHSPNDGHSQGIYAADINGLTIDGCIFDNNGYNLDAPLSEPTIFNHNMYLQTTNKNVVLTNNIISRASSHGCHFRNGGHAEGNFFYQNPINLQVGYKNHTPEPSLIRGNVITEGTNISDDLPRAWGIEFDGIRPLSVDVNVEDNVVVKRLGLSPNSRSIEYGEDIHYNDNVVYNWPPENELDDLDAVYQNPDVSINELGYSYPSYLFDAMRKHSMDKPTLAAKDFVSLYKDAFTKVN